MAEELSLPPSDPPRDAVTPPRLPPPFAGPPSAATLPVNVLSIASLTAGLLAFRFVPLLMAPLAFLWGLAALGQISRSDDEDATGRWLAIAGIVLAPCSFLSVLLLAST